MIIVNLFADWHQRTTVFRDPKIQFKHRWHNGRWSRMWRYDRNYPECTSMGTRVNEKTPFRH